MRLCFVLAAIATFIVCGSARAWAAPPDPVVLPPVTDVIRAVNADAAGRRIRLACFAKHGDTRDASWDGE